MNNQLKIMCAALALLAAGQVSASTTWTLKNTKDTGVTVSAYSNTGGADNTTLENATWANYKDGSGKYLGLGIKNNDAYSGDTNEGKSPEHSIDNEQRYDMALLTFSELVKLTDLKLGWTTNDSDITVMAYTGSIPPTLTGKKYSELVDIGWKSIGNYYNVGTATKSINPDSVFSSYWLIGAYNPLAIKNNDQQRDSSFDYIKLASVSGCSAKELGCTPPSNDAPEPGSMALFGLGLLGLVFQRKRTAA